jgi:predicted transcriptional regulator
MEKTKLSIIDYAKKCGVSRTVIYNRINKGEIIPLLDKVKEVMYIDLTTTPIKKAGKAGRPSITETIN